MFADMNMKPLHLTTALALFIALALSSASSQVSGSGSDGGLMLDKAVRWLVLQRNSDFGWSDGATSRVLLALAAANPNFTAQGGPEALLSAKQLEIELLHGLLRHSVEPVLPATIAYFSLALNAVCKDAKNFHGHNLAASLDKHASDAEFPNYPESFGHSLTALVTCLSGVHTHKRIVRNLIHILTDEGALHSSDTQSTASLALECFRRRRNTTLVHQSLETALQKLAGRQKADGSFGNQQTTFLVSQALAFGGSESSNFNASWNESALIGRIAAWQLPDGSFSSSTMETADAVMALAALKNKEGLLALGRGHCVAQIEQKKPTILQATYKSTSVNVNSGISNSSEAPSESSASEESVVVVPEVQIRYWLWIGPNSTTCEKHLLEMRLPLNTTFFAAMKRAAELDANYEFSATKWPNGHYVHTINGFREQPIGYHYWLLYRMPSDPEPAAPPPTTLVAPGGVDETIAMDGDVFLFWYKKL